MPETKKETLPSLDEVAQLPAFATTYWELEPHQKGVLPVATGRGGPLNISWEVHGDGPRKLIFLCGLAFIKEGYQRQTLHFGHQRGSEYSVLILDNRGSGWSDKPVMRYSTSEMARDALEVVDHLGWTLPRQLHVCGVSMGGMIAQEVGYLVPERIASLSLISTAAAIENTATFTENMMNRITLLLPKSPDRSVQYAAGKVFPPGYLLLEDNIELPTQSTPRCRIPDGGYLPFRTNFERFAAQELTKQKDPSRFSKTGFLMQLIACGWHHKSPEQLEDMANKIGRERILVLHGDADGMISVPHGKKLIQHLQPAKGLIVEGLGHVAGAERPRWFNELLGDLTCQCLGIS